MTKTSAPEPSGIAALALDTITRLHGEGQTVKLDDIVSAVRASRTDLGPNSYGDIQREVEWLKRRKLVVFVSKSNATKRGVWGWKPTPRRGPK